MAASPLLAMVSPPPGFTALDHGRDRSGWRGGWTSDHRAWLVPEKWPVTAVRAFSPHPGDKLDFTYEQPADTVRLRNPQPDFYPVIQFFRRAAARSTFGPRQPISQ